MVKLFWAMLSVLLIIILICVIFFILKRRKKTPLDYYALFVMGMIWLVFGIPFKNYVLSAMGLIFSVAGLINRGKWKTNRQTWGKLNKVERKLRLIIVIVICLFVLLGIIFFILSRKGLI